MKNYLQKAMVQIGLMNFLSLKRLKILFCRYVLLLIVKAKRLVKHFMKKKYKNVFIEKVIKRKDDKLCVKRRRYDNLLILIHLINELMKKTV